MTAEIKSRPLNREFGGDLPIGPVRGDPSPSVATVPVPLDGVTEEHGLRPGAGSGPSGSPGRTLVRCPIPMPMPAAHGRSQRALQDGPVSGSRADAEES